ncbi:3-methyl-2-oxobutanoate hydroxymethyltransferase [Caenimonas soli]|uniref:3-methyl-2-oxobutanoate hydroxymethyltransferase n=1 Tax=Caenimonas soli TaxID=2735555 RepID=UPI001556CE8A|nr:3-methyl-2-oxobutanoate hydroxymethyltransferase [Caenimonas soli]NPC58166.1 3-methyl-2-oxobutanoate hydroxymethyltransferase [Caenimonas soli]
MTPPRKPITLHRLRAMHAEGEKITMLTCYDATFARVLDEAGVDCLLVGDSLGMVLQPGATPVSLEQFVHHVRSVARGNRTAWLIGEMPFESYRESKEQALRSASALMQAGAHMVKLECGGWTTDTVRFLTERGIPVCGHALGGWRVQGRDERSAALLKSDARALAEAGAAMLLLDLVPSMLASSITKELPIPIIGIGAGPDCSGQVLVLHDVLGLVQQPSRFVRYFMQGSEDVAHAVRRFGEAVKNGRFPDPELHTY